jgi:hypothetical protein
MVTRKAPSAFKDCCLSLDLLIIGFFIVGQFIQDLPWFWIVDAAIAGVSSY